MLGSISLSRTYKSILSRTKKLVLLTHALDFTYQINSILTAKYSNFSRTMKIPGSILKKERREGRLSINGTDEVDFALMKSSGLVERWRRRAMVVILI